MQRAPEIIAAVIERSAGKGKDWRSRLDVEGAIAAAQALADGQDIPGLEAYVLNNSHLLIFCMGCPWYAYREVWLLEQFFIRIGRGPLDAALRDLDNLARERGAKRIVMATSLAADDSALGRLYGRNGYRPESTQHIKDLH